MKYGLPVILVLLCCSSVFGQGDSKYQKIDELIRTNSMVDAMSALNKLKVLHRGDTLDPEYWLRYSRACYTVYKYEEARNAIDMSIKLQPKEPVYHFEKGRLLNSLGNLDSALVCLERAVLLKPDGEYFYWKGIVNQQLNQFDEAQADYSVALGTGFETPELHNNLAIVLVTKEYYQDGMIHLNRAIELDKAYAQAYSARSKLNLYLLKVDEACMDKSTAHDLGYRGYFEIPDSVCQGSDKVKWKFVGDICASNGMYKAAINAYTRLIENGYDQTDYYLNRGYCHYKLQDYTRAEQDYLRALELPGAALDILLDNLSLLYYDQGDFRKSIEYSTQRIELNPSNHVPYIDRGLCHRKLKHFKEAESDFNASLKIKPDFFRAFGYRAYLFLEMEQYQQSYEDASRSVAINPQYGYGHLVLALAKQKLGFPDFCMDLYKALNSGEPDAELAIREFCK